MSAFWGIDSEGGGTGRDWEGGGERDGTGTRCSREGGAGPGSGERKRHKPGQATVFFSTTIKPSPGCSSPYSISPASLSPCPPYLPSSTVIYILH